MNVYLVSFVVDCRSPEIEGYHDALINFQICKDRETAERYAVESINSDWLAQDPDYEDTEFHVFSDACHYMLDRHFINVDITHDELI